jgi:hypothetical protein
MSYSSLWVMNNKYEGFEDKIFSHLFDLLDFKVIQNSHAFLVLHYPHL